MEHITYNGWDCIRLTNGTVELIVTRDIGPRIIRYGYLGGPNIFGEIPADQGGRDEAEWVNRGGHRLWIAPESFPWSYETDNVPYAEAIAISGGLRTVQEAGPVTGVSKEMEILLDPRTGGVEILHRLRNKGKGAVRLAVWAVSVMGREGVAVIPLPKKVPHTECLVPTQHWSLWSYTDFADPRWDFGHGYLRLRQDPALSAPQKVGIRHREGWAAYQRGDQLFIDTFDHLEDADYPDDGVNLEVFTNEQFLELETLGPLVTLQPGATASYRESWRLFRGLPPCQTEEEIDRRIRPLAESIRGN